MKIQLSAGPQEKVVEVAVASEPVVEVREVVKYVNDPDCASCNDLKAKMEALRIGGKSEIAISNVV